MARQDTLTVVGGIALGLVIVLLALWALANGVDRTVIRTAGWLLGAVGVLIIAWSSHRAVQARRGNLSSGQERLIGAIGCVAVDCAPRGKVRLGLETWDATARPGHSLSMGERVRIVSVEGRTVMVESASDQVNGRVHR